jgi:hypothetical protein
MAAPRSPRRLTIDSCAPLCDGGIASSSGWTSSSRHGRTGLQYRLSGTFEAGHEKLADGREGKTGPTAGGPPPEQVRQSSGNESMSRRASALLILLCAGSGIRLLLSGWHDTPRRTGWLSSVPPC